jgi:hypothetical protein
MSISDCISAKNRIIIIYDLTSENSKNRLMIINTLENNNKQNYYHL